MSSGGRPRTKEELIGARPLYFVYCEIECSILIFCDVQHRRHWNAEECLCWAMEGGQLQDWIEKMLDCLAPEHAARVRVDEAIAIKYQHRPKGVFKYRCNDERSRQNLEDDVVWVCSPTSYNDPYDSSISIERETLTTTVIQDGVRALVTQELDSLLDSHQIERILSAPNPALALQELVMVEIDQVPPELQAAFREPLATVIKHWEEQFAKLLPTSHKDSLKVCSFSGTQCSIIMWSHYADQHRGFCIEYDTDSLPSESLFMRMLYPVIYSETLFNGTRYYLAAIQHPHEYNVLFPAIASLYKSTEWSYEKEWRLIIPANLVREASPWRVPTPKRVYLGARSSDSEKGKIIDICMRKGVEVHQMRLDDGTFCLRSEPI